MGENAVIHHLRHDKFAKIEEIIREARQRRVEAFLFATNTLAGQGLSAIFRNGWRVPQDFAIACFDTNEAFDIYKTRPSPTSASPSNGSGPRPSTC